MTDTAHDSRWLPMPGLGDLRSALQSVPDGTDVVLVPRFNFVVPAEVETGALIDVPLFVNEGDRIKVDTRSGKYLERV